MNIVVVNIRRNQHIDIFFYSLSLQAYEELEDLLAKHDICIAAKEKLVKDSGVAEDSAYDSIVQKLLTKPRARGESIFVAINAQTRWRVFTFDESMCERCVY